MQTKLRRREPSTTSPAPSADRLTLQQVLDGPRPGTEHPDRDRLWRDLRREIGAMLVGGDYDPRRLAGLSDVEAATWREDRYAWLAAHSRDDPRVSL